MGKNSKKVASFAHRNWICCLVDANYQINLWRVKFVFMTRLQIYHATKA